MLKRKVDEVTDKCVSADRTHVEMFELRSKNILEMDEVLLMSENMDDSCPVGEETRVVSGEVECTDRRKSAMRWRMLMRRSL